MPEFQKDLTKGSVTKQLILFSLPFMLSNLIQALYNIADIYIVQWAIGDSGSSAVGNGGQLTLLVTNFIVGFAIGGTILISQYFGAGKHKDVHETISTLFTMFIYAAIIFTVLFVLLARPLLTVLKVNPDAFEYAWQYTVICMCGNIFIFGYNAISAVLRGMGDTKRPLIFVTVACFINIILDILFVKFLGLGVAGSALATVIAQASSLIFSVIYLKKSKFVFDFKPKSFIIHKDKLVKIIRIGLPTSIQNSAVTLSFLTITSVINSFGTTASAAAQLCGKFNGIAILPSIAMSASVSSMSGQNIGAGKLDRAKKCMLVGLAVAVPIGTLLCIASRVFAPEIMYLLSSGDASVINEGVVYMRAMCLDYVSASVMFCFVGLINGSGHTKITLLLNLLSAFIIRAPLAFITARVLNLGMAGVGYCAPAASAVVGIIAFLYICSGKWKTPPKSMKNIRIEE